jgi:hypothetical protein
MDSSVIEKTENARLAVGTVEKHEQNPLFGEDKPWEMRFDNLYANVVYDREEELYKCWYSPFIIDSSAMGMTPEQRKRKYGPPKDREMGICYAVSKDGISWEKPNLGLVEFAGNKKNNLVWRGPHGAGVFKDPHDPDPNRRYKTLFKGKIISVAFSADGLHWGKAIECPEANVPGDTHNNVFWAPTLGRYVGITRMWGERRGRQVARTETEDFLKWSAAEVVLEGLDKELQTYAMPVFYYGGIYIGLVAIHNQLSDRVHTELTWSSDTRTWHRVSPGIPLIPNSEKELEYDWGCVYAAAYPVFLKDEIRLYYGGSDYLHTGWRCGFFCLATLRPDGFAGYEQVSEEKPAVITTTPVSYSGQKVRITADVTEGGSIHVSLVDEDGNYIAAAETVSKTVTDGHLRLSKRIEADEIRIKFEFGNAKLYSFSLID